MIDINDNSVKHGVKHEGHDEEEVVSNVFTFTLPNGYNEPDN